MPKRNGYNQKNKTHKSNNFANLNDTNNQNQNSQEEFGAEFDAKNQNNSSYKNLQSHNSNKK